MKDMNKISLISLGCAKALVDSELLLGSLNKYNVLITDRHDQADVIIVNTCGFLDTARQESIDTIFEAASLKTKGNLKKLVVMGCLSERYPEELSKQIPEVDKFFGTTNQNQIIQYLFGKEYVSDDPNYYRSLLTPNHYAYLKIAEGCDNGCSFCSIPLMRGLQKSRSIDSILWEVEKLLENNVKEIMVIAQDSTSYGWDLRPKSSLANLIQELDKSGIDWFRLHYAHPAHLSLKIIDALANASNFCRYIDMPVQHGSDKILKSMRRGLDSKSINKRIDLLKKKMSDYFKVKRPGLISTFQDLGRFGLQHLGIVASGCMDQLTFCISNKLVGNKISEGAIEFAYQGPLIELIGETVLVAISGDVNFNNKIINQRSKCIH